MTDSEPMRFRTIDDGKTVEIKGTIGNAEGGTSSDLPELTTVVTLSEQFRPDRDHEFDCECATGRTTVMVMTSGDIRADPNVGWVRFTGTVRYPLITA